MADDDIERRLAAVEATADRLERKLGEILTAIETDRGSRPSSARGGPA